MLCHAHWEALIVFTPIVPILAEFENPNLSLENFKTKTNRYWQPHLRRVNTVRLDDTQQVTSLKAPQTPANSGHCPGLGIIYLHRKERKACAAAGWGRRGDNRGRGELSRKTKPQTECLRTADSEQHGVRCGDGATKDPVFHIQESGLYPEGKREIVHVFKLLCR